MTALWDLDKFENNIVAITDDGEKISYGSFSESCADLIKHINPRSLILNFCLNDLGSLVGYVAFLNNKIVPIMVKSDIEETIAKNLFNLYLPDYIYIPSDRKSLFPDLKEVYSHINFSLLKTNIEKNDPLSDELALLLTTSGSTGSPKLVRQSYQNIRSNMDSIVEYLKLDQNEVAITTLPMNYTYGISIINSHLAVGATIVLSTKTLMQKEFWKQLTDFSVTSIAGVPYTYEMLDRLRFFRMDFPKIKKLTQAGGKLSKNIHEKFAIWAKETKKEFIVMYGQTEATARMSYLPSESSIEKAGSIGIAIPGGTLEISEEGELIYKGKNVTLGYAVSREDLNKGDEFKGVLYTGDMARQDEDGFYYIVGRKKRFLKIFGNRVNLDEIEQLVKDRFELTECACAGYDDKMFIFTNKEDLKKDILDFVSKLTSLNPIAFKFVLIDEIPKNEAGKILYSALDVYYA